MNGNQEVIQSVEIPKSIESCVETRIIFSQNNKTLVYIKDKVYELDVILDALLELLKDRPEHKE